MIKLTNKEKKEILLSWDMGMFFALLCAIFLTIRYTLWGILFIFLVLVFIFLDMLQQYLIIKIRKLEK